MFVCIVLDIKRRDKLLKVIPIWCLLWDLGMYFLQDIINLYVFKNQETRNESFTSLFFFSKHNFRLMLVIYMPVFSFGPISLWFFFSPTFSAVTLLTIFIDFMVKCLYLAGGISGLPELLKIKTKRLGLMPSLVESFHWSLICGLKCFINLI